MTWVKTAGVILAGSVIRLTEVKEPPPIYR